MALSTDDILAKEKKFVILKIVQFELYISKLDVFDANSVGGVCDKYSHRDKRLTSRGGIL